MTEPAAAATIAPETLDQAAGAISGAAVRGDAIAFSGGATAAGFGYAAERVDLVLDTRKLSRIVEYAPSDMVVEVEAGCTLADLQAHLAPHRQRLALDPPAPERATVGGIVATNAFGPHRARFGSVRDLIVGVSLVRADGARARGGGKVVKNVAGFDLPKIAVGSLGSLGMIATATFRLHPLPESSSLSCVPGCAGRDLRPLVREIAARQLEPAAMIAVRTGADIYDTYVLFEGFEGGVNEQRDRLCAIASNAGLAEPVERDPADVAALDGTARMHGDLRLRVAMPPAALDRLVRDVVSPLADAFEGARVAIYPTLGTAFVAASNADAAGTAAQIAAARAVAEELHGNLVVLEAPALVHGLVDAYGTLPASFALMRELKLRFDPGRRLNRGRFLGRL